MDIPTTGEFLFGGGFAGLVGLAWRLYRYLYRETETKLARCEAENDLHRWRESVLLNRLTAAQILIPENLWNPPHLTHPDGTLLDPDERAKR